MLARKMSSTCEYSSESAATSWILTALGDAGVGDSAAAGATAVSSIAAELCGGDATEPAVERTSGADPAAEEAERRLKGSWNTGAVNSGASAEGLV